MPTFDRVIPLLVHRDIQAAHAFLVAAFSFESGRLAYDSEGALVHGEVRAGPTKIWLHRVTAEHELAAPSVASSGLVVHVDDVDAHDAQARSCGVRLDSSPQDMPYGQREYGARDLEGHRWWFATPLEQAPPTASGV